MRRPKLVSNVAEHGFMRPFAQTRGRLITSVGLATLLEAIIGLSITHYILETSTSVLLNLLLITFVMVVTVVAAYLQTVLVGDLFFGRMWREQVVLGRTTEQEATVKSHSAEFTIIFLILAGASTIALDVASGGFFDRYHNEGFFEARLRSEDPAERLTAFEDLRDPMNFQIWERPGIQKLVLDHLDDPATEPRLAAIWCAGHLKLEASRASLEAIITDASVSTAIRAEAAQALGKLSKDESSRKLMESQLNSKDDALLIGLLRGLALSAAPLSVGAAGALVSHDSFEVKLYAYWVLRSTENPKVRTQLHQRLESDSLSPDERCAVVDTLKMVATKEDVMWARQQYRQTDKNQRCKPIIWEERDETQHYITYGDTYRVKLLKIVANADAEKNLKWFQRLAMDPAEEDHVREVASVVIRQIEDN